MQKRTFVPNDPMRLPRERRDEVVERCEPRARLGVRPSGQHGQYKQQAESDS
jgi:hypothetical protein